MKRKLTENHYKIAEIIKQIAIVQPDKHTEIVNAIYTFCKCNKYYY